MPDTLELAKNLEPFILIPVSTSVTEALTLLHRAGVAFAVVDDTNILKALLQENHLGTLKELIIPASGQRRGNIDEPFLQGGPSQEVSFHPLHGFLRQFHPGLIGGCHQIDHRMVPFPAHRFGKLDNGIHRIEQRSIPMLF